MYSWEIDKAMKEHNYDLPSGLYLKICKESPQIRNVTYSACGDSFDIWTDDGSHWNFKVHKEERG